ncbi:MAG TPA: hypothetical protein VH475_14310 [Tepidisphaeraceae bacterium]
MDAHAIHDGTIAHRARVRLAESPDYDDLRLLGELDRIGRRTGVQVCTVDEAREYVRRLDDESSFGNGGWSA